ncbi:MAG TPA: ASCH domain-containing protein [Bryobacteraceae bacterium]|nr:ASCH domain-containing protein [Bryobacteraceae bacterium]
MLLGFQRRFAPFVQEGSKTHTIRAARKIPPRVGETCHCYVDPRRKTMRLLGRWPCVRVQKIRIAATGDPSVPLKVSIDGSILSPDEAGLLFFRDGFRDKTGEIYQHMQQAAEFWKDRLYYPATSLSYKACTWVPIWTVRAAAAFIGPAHRNLVRGGGFHGHLIHWRHGAMNG